MTTDTADFIGFLKYYLLSNTNINLACGGKCEPYERNLLINPLVDVNENSTQTCIILDEVYRSDEQTPGGEWTGWVKFGLTITIAIISPLDRATINSLASLISHYVVNGIPATDYDGNSYYLQTTGKPLGQKFVNDPESEFSKKVLTLMGHGYYQK